MTRGYDAIAFPVTGSSAVSPTDGTPAIDGRVFYDNAVPSGIQFRSASGQTWDVLFADLPWYDAEHGIGAHLEMALHLLRLALRLIAQRLPDRGPIVPFAPPAPVPGLAPNDPTLLSAYLNTQVRPYLGALVQEMTRVVNAVIAVANALLGLTREP